MLLISDPEVRQVLSMRDCIAVMERAFAETEGVHQGSSLEAVQMLPHRNIHKAGRNRR